MKEIGGYFELELRKGNHFHHAIELNSGRNAFEVILRNNQYKKIWVPNYTCNAILDVIAKTKQEYGFYKIDENLEPFVSPLERNEVLLYTNYFGLKGNLVKKLASQYNIIVDNTQAFYATPLPMVNTFYSCRKFFGVPDGAYLYTNNACNQIEAFNDDVPHYSHLIKRLNGNASDGYCDYREAEDYFKTAPIQQMSAVTSALLENVNYVSCAEIRHNNFMHLHNKLGRCNELKWIDTTATLEAPMVYPLLIKSNKLRQKLIDSKIFVATYWPEIFKRCAVRSWECYLAEYLIALPIDQRYGIEEMDYILERVL
jgi:hypothetical protein